MPDGVSAASRLRTGALMLVVAVLLSRVLGFARESYIAAAFGVTGVTDAFYAAFTVPDLFNYFLAGGALSITFIPIYTRYLAASDEAEGDRVFSTIATLMSGVLVVLVFVLGFAMPAIMARYLDRVSPDHLQLAVSLSRILLPAQIAFYLGGLCSATLMARQRFVAVAFAPLVYNAGTILGGVLLGRWLGIASLAWGTLAGAVLGPFLIQAIAAGRAGLHYRPRLAFRHPEVLRWLKLSLPLMLGVSLIVFDEVIMRRVAQGTTGAITTLSYARKLVQVPIAIAGQALGQASMPFFARLYAEAKRTELAELVVRAARGSAVIAGLAGGALAAVAIPAVSLLFGHGRFTADNVVPTAHYVAIFAAAIPLWGAQGILARAIYATGDTLSPMTAGTVVTIASYPIYVVLHRHFGITGLAVASDIGIMLHTLALLAILPRRLPEVDRRALVLGALRGILVAAIAVAPAYFVARWLPTGHVIVGHALDIARIGAGGLVFVTVALLIAGPLGVPESQLLVTRLRARFRVRG